MPFFKEFYNFLLHKTQGSIKDVFEGIECELCHVELFFFKMKRDGHASSEITTLIIIILQDNQLTTSHIAC
ncbi:CLUMA_CG020506, isoform A [Clunio marinus]|uniref:CLUMA_CG020506, isoform A n=1 Tax=Clunio marinus TaxID=568069 RepID=A0A1J1J557_9DIPT|nr:CLUMA_CG020506, isoform A [Clunio marinus]